MEKNTADIKAGRENILRTGISILAGITVFVLIVLLYVRMGEDKREGCILPQEQEFDVVVNGESFPSVKLREFSFPALAKGSRLEYSTRLQGKVDAPVLRLFAAHSIVDVYLDDSLIYHYGKETQHMLGYGYLSIPLPTDYEGRLLRVEQNVRENGEVNRIRLVTVVDANYYNNGLFGAKRILLFVDCAMIVLSLTVIVVGLLFLRRNPEGRSLIWMAVAFCGMGSWEFCISNLMDLFAKNQLALKSYIEYLSLYIAPLFFALYFAEDLYYKNKSKGRVLFPVMIAAQVSFPIIALFLHLTDVIHLPRVLLVAHAEMGIGLIYILVMNIVRALRKEALHKEMMIGTVALVGVGLVEIVRYLLYKYVNIWEKDYESIILVGLYIFALSVVVDFFNTQQRTMVAEAKNEALERIAYVDLMTGVFNRQKVNEIEEQICRDGKAFGIVNFDLNDLKKANDKYGHIEGDRLITDFAKLLADVFGKDGLVARLGGDEFIVIYQDLKRVDHEALMEKLKTECGRRNEKRGEVRISYAGGFSEPTEEELAFLKDPDSPESRRVFRTVYKRADVKMYENKARIKEQENGGKA